MTNVIILKPCPCCGGKPLCKKYEADSEKHQFTYFTDRYAIQCEYTGADQGCGMESGHYKTLDEAIERWNMRFPMVEYPKIYKEKFKPGKVIPFKKFPGISTNEQS